MLLRKIHRLNAVAIVIFLAMHLLTHISGFWGLEFYNKTQGFFRLFYRQPLVEILLLASLAIQVGLGFILSVRFLKGYWRRKKFTKAKPIGFWPWVQIISGVGFLFFILQHVFSMLVARFYFGLDTNFYWPASVMQGPPLVYYFAPYYYFAVWSVLAHVGAGARRVLTAYGYSRLANMIAWFFLLGGAALAAFIVPILMGAYFDISLPVTWLDYLHFYVPGVE